MARLLQQHYPIQRFLNGGNHFHSEFPLISAATLATRLCDPQSSGFRLTVTVIYYDFPGINAVG